MQELLDKEELFLKSFRKGLSHCCSCQTFFDPRYIDCPRCGGEELVNI
jgi:uncharacterized paraquat-inducible protein A